MSAPSPRSDTPEGPGSVWGAPTLACRSPTPWPPITGTGWSVWSSPRPLPGAPAVPPPAAQRPALAPRLQPAPRRGERSAREGTGGHLPRRGVRRLGRDNKLPEDAVRYHIDTLASDPDALPGSFGFYRAIPTPTAQNQQRKEQRLTLPVLAALTTFLAPYRDGPTGSTATCST
jgi:hypothetical protein